MKICPVKLFRKSQNNPVVRLGMADEGTCVGNALKKIYNTRSTLENYAKAKNIDIEINPAEELIDKTTSKEMQDYFLKNLQVKVRNNKTQYINSAFLDTTKNNFEVVIPHELTLSDKNPQIVNSKHDDNIIRALFRLIDSLSSKVNLP